jgi:hypothetical protein
VIGTAEPPFLCGRRRDFYDALRCLVERGGVRCDRRTSSFVLGIWVARCGAGSGLDGHLVPSRDECLHDIRHQRNAPLVLLCFARDSYSQPRTSDADLKRRVYKRGRRTDAGDPGS